MPVYNVESYLAACLDSIAAQAFGDMEVVMVDDGSTDRSSTIAQTYADRHPTWRVVRTDNRGLGAARNRGVQEATGEYLAFVDSDDLLPDYAYDLMVGTLDASGSDFVVGSLQQLIGDDLVEPEFIRAGVSQRRIGIRAADVPPIIRNVFAWNKVFRRSFYDRAGIRFPEGLHYEDQPATMLAYLVSDRFDVVRRPVYTWRVRTDGTSITQRRAQLADLEDRLETKRLTSEVVRSHGDETIRDYWDRLALVGDLPVYFEQIPGVDEVYWQRLVHGLRDLLDGHPPIEDSMLRLPQRLIGWLVVQDRRADAERVLRWLQAHPGPLALRVEDDHVVAVDLPLASDESGELPESVRYLGSHELVFDARLVDVRWEGTTLVLTGWAVIRGAPTTGAPTRVRAELRGLVDSEYARSTLGAPVPGAVTRFAAPEATAWIDRGDQEYDDSGFVARFDLAAWTAQPSRWRAELTVALDIDVARLHRSGPFRSRVEGLDLSSVPTTGKSTIDWRPGVGLVVVPH